MVFRRKEKPKIEYNKKLVQELFDRFEALINERTKVEMISSTQDKYNYQSIGDIWARGLSLYFWNGKGINYTFSTTYILKVFVNSKGITEFHTKNYVYSFLLEKFKYKLDTIIFQLSEEEIFELEKSLKIVESKGVSYGKRY